MITQWEWQYSLILKRCPTKWKKENIQKVDLSEEEWEYKIGEWDTWSSLNAIMKYWYTFGCWMVVKKMERPFASLYFLLFFSYFFCFFFAFLLCCLTKPGNYMETQRKTCKIFHHYSFLVFFYAYNLLFNGIIWHSVWCWLDRRTQKLVFKQATDYSIYRNFVLKKGQRQACCRLSISCMNIVRAF